MTELVEQIARALAEQAEQACRYVAKHNLINLDGGPYRDGFETACEVCEAAIMPSMQRHIDRITADILPLIESHTAAAVNAERERCAKVAEEYPSTEYADIAIIRGIAAAIRSQP